MSSEQTPPNVIRITQPLNPRDGDTRPSTASQEGDPFISRQGSPSRPAPNVDTGTGNILPTAMDVQPLSSASMDRHGDRDRESFVAVGTGQPLGIRLPEEIPTSIRRQRTTDTRMSAARRSNIDWIVPMDSSEKAVSSLSHPPFSRTFAHRLANSPML